MIVYNYCNTLQFHVLPYLASTGFRVSAIVVSQDITYCDDTISEQLYVVSQLFQCLSFSICGVSAVAVSQLFQCLNCFSVSAVSVS